MPVLGIKDVALAAGVSQATASRALSGRGSVSPKTRARVQAAAADLGFQISYHASSLATGRSRNIGVVLPYVNRWYFSTVLEGLTRPLIDAGYDLTLYDFQGDLHRRTVLDDFLLRKRLDGVITVGLRLNEADTTRFLSLDIPVVSIGGSLPGIASLTIDEHAIGRLAADHLIGLGHTRVAHIGGEHESNLYFHVSWDRREGYRAAMEAAGLEQRSAWSVISDYTVNSAYEVAKSLLADPHNRPTAICCASDEMAIGAILAARDLGLHIPEQLSVIGVDKHPLGVVFGLTTIDQFVEEQGTRAAHTLLDELAETHEGRRGTLPSLTELPITIVTRSSTASPTKNKNPTFH
ncbi:LacI family DNA-binding transcriptional regulator [Arthrobacter sp. RIT-PI-e]|uniref:LacI family DNA-binding transcriptional regulator n=1 Tax=Arthrobacter sp. RIT-PI-e TaxID=1681197 RepID=UPI001F491C7C|nr:LacI family DNA-binding transcriptional regulator [Arthrobacter sp. RIT-PI-e]